MGVGVGDVGECGHAARRMLQPRAPILASASARSFIACPLWARTCLILTTSPRLRKRASTALFASTILLFDLGFHAPVVVWMARNESARMCNSCPPGSVMSFSPSVRRPYSGYCRHVQALSVPLGSVPLGSALMADSAAVA